MRPRLLWPLVALCLLGALALAARVAAEQLGGHAPVTATLTDLRTGQQQPLALIPLGGPDLDPRCIGSCAPVVPVPTGNNEISTLSGYDADAHYTVCYALDAKRPGAGNAERAQVTCYQPLEQSGWYTPSLDAEIALSTPRGILHQHLVSDGQNACLIVLTDRGDGDVNRQQRFVLCTPQIVFPDSPARVGLIPFLRYDDPRRTGVADPD